jgi:hypothetical protein
MSLAVHHGSELTKVLMAVIAVAVFVVLGLTFAPELISGSQSEVPTGSTTRMIR